MAFVNLQTERLIIRDHKYEDLYTHHQLFSNPVVMYYLQDIQTQSLEESKQNLLQAIDEIDKDNRTKYFLRIEENGTSAHIGESGYTVNQETPFGKLVGLGYFINKEFWGKGYVTEAVKEVLRYAFEENNVFRVSTGCIKENQGSEKVMQKCNMIKEGDFKMYSWHDGKLKDRVEYRLLKDEWNSMEKLNNVSKFEKGVKIMFNVLKQYITKLYTPSTNKFWDDEHILKSMLEAHLNPNWDAATRKPEFLDKSVNWISKIAPPSQYKFLLDLGCGPGLYAERFNSAGYSITGVDFSKRSIAYQIPFYFKNLYKFTKFVYYIYRQHCQ